MDITKLLHNLEKLGCPQIFVYCFGFQISLIPDIYQITDGELVFNLAGQTVCKISLLGDVFLKQKIRPDNLIIKCYECYGVYQRDTVEHVCDIVWPE